MSTVKTSVKHHAVGVSALKQEKGGKANRKEKVQLSLFAEDMIIYVDNLREWGEGVIWHEAPYMNRGQAMKAL